MEEFLIDKVMSITNEISKHTSKLIRLKSLLINVEDRHQEYFTFYDLSFSITKKQVLNMIEKRIEKEETEKKAKENLLLQIINKKR